MADSMVRILRKDKIAYEKKVREVARANTPRT